MCLQRVVSPVLKTLKSSPDNLEEYKTEFGAYMGPSLHAGVVKSRQMPQTAVRPRAVVGQVSVTGWRTWLIGTGEGAIQMEIATLTFVYR